MKVFGAKKQTKKVWGNSEEVCFGRLSTNSDCVGAFLLVWTTTFLQMAHEIAQFFKFLTLILDKP